MSIKIDPETLECGHRVCFPNVAVPTITVEPFLPDGEPEIFVQWFGENDMVDLGARQFRFPVPTRLDAVHWMGHPELCNVILLGQVKDWPAKEAIPAVARTVSKGDVEAWVLWVVATHYGVKAGAVCFQIGTP